MKKIILLMCVILTSCATEEKYNAKLNTWLNSPKEDLVLSWGVPSATYSVNKKTELITYKRSSISSYNGNIYNWNCDTTFTITDGIITNWKWEGNSCRSD